MRSVTGGSLPAEIWKEVMLKAQEGLMAQPLPGTEIDAELAKKARRSPRAERFPRATPFDGASSPTQGKKEQAERQRTKGDARPS